MKFKPTVLLAAFVVALGLLLGTSAAQATEVILDGDGNVTQILNLPVTDEVRTTVYNVEFIYATAEEVYGSDFEFDFPPPGELILVALNAVNNALNNNDPIPVGAGPEGTRDYFIGHVKEIFGIVVAAGGERIAGNWEPCKGEQCLNPGDINTGFAILGPNETVTLPDFTEADLPPPEQVTIGGTVTGLVGRGLSLLNNGTDDLNINQNGEFEFATRLTPGESYNVTVLTNPKNPTQTCSVENGSGTVPLEPVTDVVVSCAEPIPGKASIVVSSYQDLPDGTFLEEIIYQGGVAINSFGDEVAFLGTSGADTGVFTQERLVTLQGDTLPDGSKVSRIYYNDVAINFFGEVAFHGRDVERFEAMFTQFGLVAKENGISPKAIEDTSAVGINFYGQVAYLGDIDVVGLSVRAVFIDDEVVVKGGDTLPDNNRVSEISPYGVAINDFGQVAFHGATSGGQAVFTQDRLVAKEGDTLPDGSILATIRKNAGVAINLLGQVVFQGRVFDPASGIVVFAVFTQERLVVKEGDTLPDGTILETINEIGGVAINDFGQVAFHGRTGGVEAVFISDGRTTQVLAKEGDNLSDGATTLESINESGGVAINNFGEVVFFGLQEILKSGTGSPSLSPR